MAEVTLVDLETGQVISRTPSIGGDGFVIPLPGLGAYSFEASAEGHLFGMTTYNQTGGSDMNRSPFVQIELDPIEVGQTFTLNAIQFDYGLADLSSSYQAGCERLAQWMLDNPGVNIRVEGHTDNVGPNVINEKIGMERAGAVQRYLYEQYQIPLHKMNVISYGEEKPVAPNKTKAGRAQNRRVVIKVLA